MIKYIINNIDIFIETNSFDRSVFLGVWDFVGLSCHKYGLHDQYILLAEEKVAFVKDHYPELIIDELSNLAFAHSTLQVKEEQDIAISIYEDVIQRRISQNDSLDIILKEIYELTTCYSLSKIIIPNGVTSIGTSSFANNTGLGFIKFLGSTPPTASNANWYTSLPKDCKIYVPTGSLSAYTSATNYPPSTTYTYEEY